MPERLALLAALPDVSFYRIKPVWESWFPDPLTPPFEELGCWVWFKRCWVTRDTALSVCLPIVMFLREPRWWWNPPGPESAYSPPPDMPKEQIQLKVSYERWQNCWFKFLRELSDYHTLTSVVDTHLSCCLRSIYVGLVLGLGSEIGHSHDVVARTLSVVVHRTTWSLILGFQRSSSHSRVNSYSIAFRSSLFGQDVDNSVLIFLKLLTNWLIDHLFRFLSVQ